MFYCQSIEQWLFYWCDRSSHWFCVDKPALFTEIEINSKPNRLWCRKESKRQILRTNLEWEKSIWPKLKIHNQFRLDDQLFKPACIFRTKTDEVYRQNVAFSCCDRNAMSTHNIFFSSLFLASEKLARVVFTVLSIKVFKTHKHFQIHLYWLTNLICAFS